jgi:hypothetical protein
VTSFHQVVYYLQIKTLIDLLHYQKFVIAKKSTSQTRFSDPWYFNNLHTVAYTTFENKITIVIADPKYWTSTELLCENDSNFKGVVNFHKLLPMTKKL